MKSEQEAKQAEFEAFYWQLQEKVSKLYKEFDLEAVRVAFGVLFTYNAIEARLLRRLQAANLTIPGLNILILLTHGNLEGYPLTELSRFLVTSRANITGVIDSLVRRGFVVRTDHPEDRRSVIAKITPAGRKWLDGYFPGHAKMMSSFAAALNQEERRKLLELLGKVRQHALKEAVKEMTASKSKKEA